MLVQQLVTKIIISCIVGNNDFFNDCDYNDYNDYDIIFQYHRIGFSFSAIFCSIKHNSIISWLFII